MFKEELRDEKCQFYRQSLAASPEENPRELPRSAGPKRPEAASPQSSHRGWINRSLTKLSQPFQRGRNHPVGPWRGARRQSATLALQTVLSRHQLDGDQVE